MPGSRTGARKIRRYRLSALYAYIDQHTIEPRRGRVAQPPTPAELETAIDHLAYEMAAAEASARDFLQTRHRWALEAFLVHARLLRAFFLDPWEPSGRHAGQTIVAEHYFHDVTRWRGVKGIRAAALSAAKHPMDRQVAHLARGRVRALEFRQLEPLVEPMLQDLQALWRRFLARVQAPGRFAAALERKAAELS